MRRRPAALTATLVLLAGCSTGGTTQKAAPATTTTAPEIVLPGVDGRFLALTGPNSLDAGLDDLTFAPVRLHPLTPVRRVSTIGACPTRVVVAAAQPEVGYNDHLQTFAGGRFGPLDGLGTPHALDPVLDTGCRVLYIDPFGGTPDGDDRLHVWDPSTRTDRVVATYAEFGGTAWGPGGRIGFVERPRAEQGKDSVDRAVVVLDRRGTRRSLAPPATDLTNLEWGASGWMALGRLSGDVTIFLQPDTGERHDLAGWAPRAWSPDGKRLLVAAAGEHRRLGVVELPDLTSVRPLGEAPQPVHATVWLPAGSDPIGPASS